MCGFAFLAVLGVAFSGQSFAEPIASDQFTVTDGDTIRVKARQHRYRLWLCHSEFSGFKFFQIFQKFKIRSKS